MEKQRAVNVSCMQSLALYGFVAGKERRITPEDISLFDEHSWYPIIGAISFQNDDEQREPEVTCIILKPQGDGIVTFDIPLEIYNTAPTVEALESIQ